MTDNRISVATMTYDGFGDGALMKKALSVLAKKGYKAFVADGGSSPEFIADLSKMGHYVYSPITGGLTEQYKNSIVRASEKSAQVLYTEPDKLDWFNLGLEKSIDEYFTRGLEFAAVSRNPETMATFPIHQQRTEGFANEYISRVVLGKTGGDFIYGPKLFVSTLGETLKEVSANSLTGWQSLMFLVAKAHKKDLKIDCLPYAAECPISQRIGDSEQYRIKQMCDNLNGFLLGLK